MKLNYNSTIICSTFEVSNEKRKYQLNLQSTSVMFKKTVNSYLDYYSPKYEVEEEACWMTREGNTVWHSLPRRQPELGRELS